MLEEMLNKLLAKLWDMPQLNLTTENLEKFYEQTNNIRGDITYVNYQLLQTPEDEARLWFVDKIKIENYLLRWPQLVNDLDNLFTAITLTWCELYRTVMSCDDLLPILIEIMPRDKLYLAKLMPLFSFAANINKGSMTNYCFTQLCSAAYFYVQDKKPQEKDEHAENHFAVINRLRNANFFGIISLMLALKNIFESRMITLARQIYILLHQHNHHEYDIRDEINSKNELLDAWNSKITDMLGVMEDQPFCGDAALSHCVERYLVYMELHIAISCLHPSARHKLSEIVTKSRRYQSLIQQDFDSITIEPSDEIIHYLKIPAAENSLFSIFSTRSVKMTLTMLINFLEAKMQALENEFIITPTATNGAAPH